MKFEKHFISVISSRLFVITHLSGSHLLRPGSHERHNGIIPYVGNVNISLFQAFSGEVRKAASRPLAAIFLFFRALFLALGPN